MGVSLVHDFQRIWLHVSVGREFEAFKTPISSPGITDRRSQIVKRLSSTKQIAMRLLEWRDQLQLPSRILIPPRLISRMIRKPRCSIRS